METFSRAGDANAQYGLGVMYHNGYGVKQDDFEAVNWYRKAAEQGHASAQYSLGSCTTMATVSNRIILKP